MRPVGRRLIRLPDGSARSRRHLLETAAAIWCGRREARAAAAGSHIHVVLVALLPPCREALEQAQGTLGALVMRHLMLELATLLREGARALVNPLVAVYLVLAGWAG